MELVSSDGRGFAVTMATDLFVKSLNITAPKRT
jgi:hypothetical protein